MLRQLTVLFSALLLVLQLFAQYKVTVGDHTWRLTASPDDTTIVRALIDSAHSYENARPPHAMKYAEKAVIVSEKLAWRQGVADAYNTLGNLQHTKGELLDALKSYGMALNQYTKLKDERGIIDSWNRMAQVRNDRSEMDIAMDLVLKTLNRSEETGYKKGAADANYQMGRMLSNRGQYEKSLDYFKESERIAREIGYKKGIGRIYNGIGGVYYGMKDWDQAMTWFTKSYKQERSLGNKKAMGTAYNNIGILYKKQGEYDKALEYYINSLNFSEEVNDTKGTMFALNSIGELFFNKGHIGKAFDYKLRSLQKAEKMEALAFRLLLYKDLFTILTTLGRYKEAGVYGKMVLKLQEDIHKNQVKAETTEMEARYQTAKKEQQITEQQLELSKKEIQLDKDRQVTYALIGGVAILLIIAFFLYNRYRVKERTSEKLEIKNKIIEQQQASMLDSINYAQRIQRSIMMDEADIRKYLPKSFVVIKPRDIVSGDFYWFGRQGEKSVLAVADCTGHGVPGAFMSMIGSMLLNRIVHEREVTDPAEILSQLHNGVLEALQQEKGGSSQDGMDIALCTFDDERREVHFAGAMNPLYVVGNGGVEVIKADIKSIGGKSLRSRQLAQVQTFTNHTISYEEGKSLFLLTDGYLDQFGGDKNEKFSSKRFRQLLLDNRDVKMTNIKESFLTTMDDWQGGQKQIDDMLVVGVRL